MEKLGNQNYFYLVYDHWILCHYLCWTISTDGNGKSHLLILYIHKFQIYKILYHFVHVFIDINCASEMFPRDY